MMNSNQWPTFDASSLQPLDSSEIKTIESACDKFNENFNNRFSDRYQYLRYQWTAAPGNFGDLDFDFYEFGGEHWYQDNGYGFTCAWGEILVKSFGFQWMKMEGATNLRDWVLLHDDAFQKFFPWHLLWSIVESGGHQFDKAEGAWMRILDQVDAVYPLPTGWHVISDVLSGEADWVPERVASEMKVISERPDWHFGVLGLWPYELTPESNWDEVLDNLKSKQIEMDGWWNDD